MKKINLKGLLETLSEKELKGVMAGSGDECKDAACNPNTTCRNTLGTIGHCMVNGMSGHCVCGAR
jgi:hypothetical protein